jgi:hypothetical protein
MTFNSDAGIGQPLREPPQAHLRRSCSPWRLLSKICRRTHLARGLAAKVQARLRVPVRTESRFEQDDQAKTRLCRGTLPLACAPKIQVLCGFLNRTKTITVDDQFYRGTSSRNARAVQYGLRLLAGLRRVENYTGSSEQDFSPHSLGRSAMTACWCGQYEKL